VVEKLRPSGTMLCVVSGGANIQGKFSMVKHLRLAKSMKTMKVFPLE